MVRIETGRYLVGTSLCPIVFNCSLGILIAYRKALCDLEPLHFYGAIGAKCEGH